jgi:hypothetical protein
MRDTVADINFVVSFVELWQVGIKHMHSDALRKNSTMSLDIS